MQENADATDDAQPPAARKRMLPDGGEDTSDDGDEDGLDTSRATVRTYVPQYQKDEWQEQAGQMDMSLSEFVRTMTQAGRRGYFDVVDLDSDVFGGIEDLVDDVEASAEDTDQDDDELDDVFTELVYRVIRESAPIDYDMLAAAAQDHIENRLHEVLDELQTENKILHKPGEGYVPADGDGGRDA